MKSKPISFVGTILLIFFCFYTKAQSIGANASAVWITNCSQSAFLNTTGAIGLSNFPSDLGVYTQNSGSLILSGAQANTFKNSASSNICSVHMYYYVHLQCSAAGSFTSVDLPLLESCNGSNQYPSDGSGCSAGDQRWQNFFTDVDLTAHAPGNYVLEVYYEITGSNTTTTQCDETITLNNGGTNYKANFAIQSPNLSSTNPSSCFGSEGSITIGGLGPNATYLLSYTDDGVLVGPASFTANSSGQIIITGLKKGFYSDFDLQINNCETNLFTGIILSDPVFVPKFNPIPPFCAGTTAPVLQSTSNNGITGTWNPPTIDNQTSASYTFTPDANQCGVPVTINVTVTPRTTPTFSFGTSLSICAGGSVPPLPPTSQNGIPGVWNPTIVDNQNSGTYAFTPNAGQCANPTTFNVTVTPNITPTFNFGTSLSVCAGQTVPSLPATSDNGITGSWSPSTVDDQNSGTYTFTPDAGQCATTTSFDVTVNPTVTPVFNFGTSLSVCSGASVPTLPSTSQNGITGSWNPSAVDNLNSGVYTFTPDAGQCATSTSFTVTINPNITPTFSFGTNLSICKNGSAPILPSTSTNGITGIWTPAAVDNQNSGSYLFVPTAGQCATTATFTITVNPNITPTFDFGTSLSICKGGTVPALPTTSINGVIGTWSPSTVDDQNSGTYTFTPMGAQCATTATFTVTVNPNVTPTFSFGTTLSICAGGNVPALPTTSQNGITGTWNPSVADNQTSNTYEFTPDAGQCAITTSFSVTVSPNITPTFSFGTSLSICAGGSVPSLPSVSDNGITGTWNASPIDNQNSATYTFTPDAGQCATTASLSVTVNPNITPSFSFGSTLTICAGSTVPLLPTTSDNGITGTWSPSTVDNQNSNTYTFTPDAGQCVTGPITFSVTVTPNVIPTFSLADTLTICNGGIVPSLPTTSDNGLTGTWNPAVVSNTASGTYIFNSNSVACAVPDTFTVIVNPIIKPTFGFGTFQSLCMGATVPVLPATSDNGISGTWNPSVVDNSTNGTYVFTPDVGQCADTTSFKLEVNAVPTVTVRTDTTVYDGDFLPAFNFIFSPGATVNWTNSDPSIGLQASGTNTVPSFTATNMSNQTVTATITATPVIGGCTGLAQTYVIKVLPLNKDVFVPNVFTPNGDGKNDLLYVYGNYITKVDMHIFNQWGQQIATISNKVQGWDGKYKGTPQPVGVYVYVLKAELSDGRTINMKGSITLLR
jgi:gliding motility-associated-like protein